MSALSEAEALVAPLVEAWCERRALGPLRHVLVAYPQSNPLTDGLADLRDALDKARVFARSDLSEFEFEQLGQAIALLDHAIHRV